jgi:hypothetical protein
MVHEIQDNKAMEKLGKRLVGELIQWAQDMDNNHEKLDITQQVRTLQCNDKFRLDMQGEFKAHGIVWFNLQVQYRDVTLYAIYVQKNAYVKGLITDKSILNENIKSAHRGYPDVTLYYKKQNPKASERERLPPAKIDPGKIDLTV